MKIPFTLLFLIALAGESILGSSANARTMENIPGLPIASFRTDLPAQAYKRLAQEPIKAYLLLRGQIVNNTVTGARVIRSEGNGVYDKVAVQIADGMVLYSFTTG